MANQKKIEENLRIFLGDDVGSDVISYTSSITTEQDLEEFMENLVDKRNRSHVQAYKTIKDCLFKKTPQKNTTTPPQNPSKKQPKPTSSKSETKKEKKKFRDINSYQEEEKVKTGRRACDCFGQEHEFMNNCMSCGRLHCIQEGPGPCLFCGNNVPVTGSDPFQSKKTIKARENKIFDDDNDYFKFNKKSTSKEDRRRMVVALDFASRRVIESTQEDVKIRQNLLKESMEHLKKVEHVYKAIQKSSELSSKVTEEVNNELIDLLIQMRHKRPAGQEDLGQEDSLMPVIDYGSKVLDEDRLAGIDHGLCLSMHQPYASLLVAGVKRHEGRTWPTTHRGRLWIAAAAKEPEEEEIVSLEGFYREYYQDTKLKFPLQYPTGCLLGCVNVEDCLEQDEYRKQFPNGESTSPFVLICSNPIILPIFYPIVGKHKIYALDKDLHNCAKMALHHSKYV